MPTEGSTISANVTRVVDGDTLVVDLDGVQEKLRIASLDTEESNPGGEKPETPFGKKAKEKAIATFPIGSQVTLEFAGTEPIDEALARYRDNFGRLLVWVYVEEKDFQEQMIREGFSPYFNKYGRADFAGHDQRYTHAERVAQSNHVGVWNQLEVNGSEMRNYALLHVWWNLRADVIDKYRAARQSRPELLNSRLDYQQIVELAAAGQTATIFTELRTFTRLGQRKAMVDIGSKAQPFKLFIPDMDTEEARDVIRLLDNRYVARDENHPGRSYAYVTGELKLFREEPEMIVTVADQLADSPPS